MKFVDYAAHGVQEYWIIDPQPRVVEQYGLAEGGEYQLLRKLDEGRIRSHAVAGYELDVQDLFRRD